MDEIMNTNEQIERLEKYLRVVGDDALICGLLASDVLEKLQDNEMLHKLLDWRDDRYFRWCISGLMSRPTPSGADKPIQDGWDCACGFRNCEHMVRCKNCGIPPTHAADADYCTEHTEDTHVREDGRIMCSVCDRPRR